MRRQMERLRRKLAFIPGFVPALVALAAAVFLVYLFAQTLEIVTVKDEDGHQQMLLTRSTDADELVRQAGFTTGGHDKVTYRQDGALGSSVFIKRSFAATLVADGETITAEYREGTVADMLRACGVRLGEHDYVEPAADTALAAGLTAAVHRVEYVRETRREEVPQETVDAYRAGLPEGTEFHESTNGPTYDVIYQDRILDGQVVESEMVELVSIIEPLTPRPADSSEFLTGVPLSRIEGFSDIEVGPDGIPLNYERLWTGAVCTAYSASRGRGSSGLGLYCGTAAVNPNVIPYGTRMYITSADGSFIYGYCIATDTGTAMMEGHVDLDLFFETNAEARRFGKRGLNVYILEGNVRNLDEGVMRRVDDEA